MRLALVSLIALSTASTALAQPAPAAPPPQNGSAVAPPAPGAAPPAAPAETPPAALAPLPQSPPPPPPPSPAPPTDPTAIAVLSVLQSVCIPAANGGNLAQLAKTAGYRKAGDNWTLRQRDYTLTIESPGTNPTQCHVDVTHPVDPQGPGRPIIVALNDWAAVEHGWSLYRNDKNVEGGVEYTTRSWEHRADGKAEGLVFLTQRHPDGTPMQHGADTSQLVYSVTNAS